MISQFTTVLGTAVFGTAFLGWYQNTLHYLWNIEKHVNNFFGLLCANFSAAPKQFSTYAPVVIIITTTQLYNLSTVFQKKSQGGFLRTLNFPEAPILQNFAATHF